MSYLGICRLETILGISQNTISTAKIKILEGGTKKYLISVFLDRNLKKLLSCLKLTPSNLSKCQVSCKDKKIYIWDQNYCFLVSLEWTLRMKKLLSYLKSTPENFSNSKSTRKERFFQIYDQKSLIWLFSGCNFKKLLSFLKSAPLNLWKCEAIWLIFRDKSTNL